MSNTDHLNSTPISMFLLQFERCDRIEHEIYDRVVRFHPAKHVAPQCIQRQYMVDHSQKLMCEHVLLAANFYKIKQIEINQMLN